MMVQHSYSLDQNTIAIDPNTQWCDSFYDDIDLGVLPVSIDDMECQIRESAHLYERELKVVPLDSQGHDSEGRLQSPTDGPMPWKYPEPAGTYQPSRAPYYRDPPAPSTPDISIPDLVHPNRSWHGAGTDADASSTVSSMNPPTPDGKAEWPVDVVSPYPQPQLSTYPRHNRVDVNHQFQYGPGNGGHLPMDDQQNAVALRGLQRTPGPGPSPFSQGPYHLENIQPKAPYSFSQGTLSPSVLPRSPIEQEHLVEETYSEPDADGDNDSEYTPEGAFHHSQGGITAQRAYRGNTRMTGSRVKAVNKLTAPQNQRNRINKRPQTNHSQGLAPRNASGPNNILPSNSNCGQCNGVFTSIATLNKHIQTRHTRPFACIFRRYGCTQTFGSKNEWTRHIRVQHLRLEIWRCDAGTCGQRPSSYTENPDEDQSQAGHCFDRKDLYTQHLRRMHRNLLSSSPSSPTTTSSHSRSGSKTNRAENNTRETDLQTRAHSILRKPYSRPICPYCTPTTEPGAWDPFLEHVARHLENGEGGDGNEDLGLRQWLVGQRLLVYSEERGEWRIVGCDGKKGANQPAQSAAQRSPTGRQGRATPPVQGTRKSARKGRKRREAVDEGEEDGVEDAYGELE